MLVFIDFLASLWILAICLAYILVFHVIVGASGDSLRGKGNVCNQMTNVRANTYSTLSCIS